MPVGIEKLDMYAPRLCADAVDLALQSGRSQEHARDELMVDTRAVVPLFEDTVTLAVNAGKRLLAGEDRSRIGLVIVGTESAVDFGKPVSTWLHRFLELPVECCNFEVKHACYSGTAALKMALAWAASPAGRGKQALVVSADYTRPDCSLSGGDVIGGGSAVAMLVSDQPHIAEIETEISGWFCHEVADTFRPTATTEMGHSETSLFSYLDALEGASAHYREQTADAPLLARFDRHIYHAPFPGMTLRAHQELSTIDTDADAVSARASWRAKVADGIRISQKVGGSYGASTFLALLSVLSGGNATAGERISMFAYGSGCQGELYALKLGGEAVQRVRACQLQDHLERRVRINADALRSIERTRAATLQAAHFEPVREGDPSGGYEAYGGRGLLVLSRVEDHVRHYVWS